MRTNRGCSRSHRGPGVPENEAKSWGKVNNPAVVKVKLGEGELREESALGLPRPFSLLQRCDISKAAGATKGSTGEMAAGGEPGQRGQRQEAGGDW